MCTLHLSGQIQYSKTCVKWPLSKRPKVVFKNKYRLMQVRSTAECILQYFRPSLRYHLSLRSVFCLFLSGHFIQVLLYDKIALHSVCVYVYEQTDLSKYFQTIVEFCLY